MSYLPLSYLMPVRTTITSIHVSMLAIQTIAMTVCSFVCSALAANVTVIYNGQMISDDEDNTTISKQFSDTYSAIKKKNRNRNKKSGFVNCYLKWDDQVEEKNYLQKMHNEIINTPFKDTFKSLYKFGYLGYLREEVFDGESYVIKRLFPEAWSEEDNDKKDRYCKVRSDILKARLPKAIEITIQKLKFEKNKNRNTAKRAITTTRKKIRRQREQNHQQEIENYISRVKSLRDFVQLFEEKEKKGQNPRVCVSYC
jgi:hypothetical protein